MGKVSQQIDSQDKINILESSFLQNTIRILFNNLYQESDLRLHNKKVLEIFTRIKPLFIYLSKKDVRSGIMDIWNERGIAYRNYSIDVDSSTPYAKANNLRGEEATIKLQSL